MRQRQDRRGRAGAARGDHPAHSAAARRPGCAAAGADRRFLVRQLRRRGVAGARGQRRAAAGRQDPRDVHRARLRGGQARPVHPEVDRARGAERRRGRLRDRRHPRDRRRAGRRHHHARCAPMRRAAAGVQADPAARVRRPVPDQRRGLRALPRCTRQAQAQRLGAALRARSPPPRSASAFAAASSGCCTWTSCRSGSSASTDWSW